MLFQTLFHHRESLKNYIIAELFLSVEEEEVEDTLLNEFKHFDN